MQNKHNWLVNMPVRWTWCLLPQLQSVRAFSALWCVEERWRNNCLLSSLVWEGSENVSLNRSQSRLLFKLVGALYWSCCWLLESHPFACSNSFEHFSAGLSGYFCRWAVVSHWDTYIESVVTSLHLPIYTSVTRAECYSFSSSSWLRFHAHISGTERE